MDDSWDGCLGNFRCLFVCRHVAGLFGGVKEVSYFHLDKDTFFLFSFGHH